MIKKLMALSFLLMSTIVCGQEVPQNSPEVEYQIPWTATNFAIQNDTSKEFKPGFLTKRGDIEAIQKYLGYGKGIKVGVVDTGLDWTHSQPGGDLEIFDGSNSDTYRVKEAKDFTNSRRRGGEPDWSDRNSHGSHVASVIGGSSKNGRGISGVAPECELYVAKGLSDEGFGSDTQIAACVDWLVEKEVDIINMSLGGSPSPRIEAAVKRAYQKGILVFAALGNSGLQGDGHPGNSVFTIGVAAVDYNLNIAEFSSRSDEARLSGYGVNVFACVSNGRYAALSGTSMATPDQAGLAALILSHQRSLGVRVKDHVTYLNKVMPFVKDLGTRGRDREYGHGFLDINEYIRYHKSQSPVNPDPIDPTEPIDPVDPKDPEIDKPQPPEDKYKGFKLFGRFHWDGKEVILLSRELEKK